MKNFTSTPQSNKPSEVCQKEPIEMTEAREFANETCSRLIESYSPELQNFFIKEVLAGIQIHRQSQLNHHISNIEVLQAANNDLNHYMNQGS